MDVKGEVLLQLLNKSKLSNGPKRFQSQIFYLLIVKFKKLGFSASLSLLMCLNEGIEPRSIDVH